MVLLPDFVIYAVMIADGGWKFNGFVEIMGWIRWR